ncbi:hypothetical protein JRO89_XSUnG0210200 [Xanthoceras sorbifolium]|uniref:N-acetyltransferase domain-containing protein n=1 Tax=Xanthoceras sorbifolium TaxID=99658 RepID=A0ABQ8GX30_9ROSI|nr:hypothetical protein JRO89_XSUnG0210200 [Xanthoceras sorbifolium]
MPGSRAIEDLCDDDFEGSHNEHRIFSEIFFGNDTAVSSKRCLVTGVINFEADNSKYTDILLCSNSENSSITSQCSSKTPFVEDSYNVTEKSGGAPASMCVPERLVFPERDDQNSSVKRMKFSFDELSNTRPDMGKALNSTVLTKEVVAGMSCPVTDPACQTVKLHLVDTSNHGVTSSCYLVKQPVDRGGDVDHFNVIKHRSTSLDGNDSKEMAVGKAIASPISQESFATRLAVASPSMTVAEKSESSLHDVGRSNAFDSLGLDVGDVSLKMGTKTDARSLLQGHIVQLLTAAGWKIETRRRPSRKYMDTVYRAPGGRLFREFTKAWRACGQIIFADRYNLVPEDEGKEWTDIHQFYTDLLNTLTNFEKEITQSDPANALAHRWSLLDPFVFVVFINRKIGSLKKGDVVKAAPTLVVDKSEKTNTILALDNAESFGISCSQKVPVQVSDTSPATKSALTVSDGSCHAYDVQSGNGSFSKYGGQTKDNTSKCLTDVSIYIADKAVDITNSAENQCFGISGTKRSNDLTSLAPCGSDSTCVQSGSCLYGVPTASRDVNNVVGMSEFASPHQDKNKISQSCNKQTSEDDVEAPKQDLGNVPMHSWEERLKLFEGQENDKVGYHLPNSLHDSVNCRNDALVHSHCFVTSGVPQQSGQSKDDIEKCIEALNLDTEDKYSPPNEKAKKKSRRKSKKISEIKLTPVDQSDILDVTLPEKTEEQDIYAISTQVEPKEVQEYLVTNATIQGSHHNSSALSSCQHEIAKKCSKFKKIHRDCDGPRTGRKKPVTCEIKDDDLLVAAIIKNKDCIQNITGSSSKMKPHKLRGRGKLKKQKGGCRLLPRTVGKPGKLVRNGVWFMEGTRTILSWMIVSGVICLNDVIQFRNPQDAENTRKDSLPLYIKIVFLCIGTLFSTYDLYVHLRRSNQCSRSLLCGASTSFDTLNGVEKLVEHVASRPRKAGGTRGTNAHDDDYICSLCAASSRLFCSGPCMVSDHSVVLEEMVLCRTSWFKIILTSDKVGDIGKRKDGESSSIRGDIDHEACLKDEHKCKGVVSSNWFCSGSCQEIYSGLQSHVGIINHIADGFSWTLLRCIHEDQKVHSAPWLALKAECNSKLAVALTIMEECFQSMVDPRTGIDMIPHVLYNWRSDFARLNFHGFYTVILEKDDVLISVASVRVHGKAVAEMPLIATCSNYRRKGMCRRLMAAIEEMLISFKVEKLVISAIPALVETWTKGFGFTPMEKVETQSLNNINLMVFPGTVHLKKSLYGDQKADRQLGMNELTEVVTCTEGEPIIGSDNKTGAETKTVKGLLLRPAQYDQTDAKDVQLCPTHFDQPDFEADNDAGGETKPVKGIQQSHFDQTDNEIGANIKGDNEFGTDMQNKLVECKNLQDSADRKCSRQEQFSKLSSDEPDLTCGEIMGKMVSIVESPCMDDETQVSLDSHRKP